MAPAVGRHGVRVMTVDELVLPNIGWARKFARRFVGGLTPREDLEQVAMVGLVRAARDFDPERGVPFQAFAAQRICGELAHEIRDHEQLIRIPRNLRYGRGVRAVRFEVPTDPDMSPIVERMPDGRAAFDERVVVFDLVESLPAVKRYIFRLRFYEGLTQREIGARLGRSQTYVSIIERAALRELRAAIA